MRRQYIDKLIQPLFIFTLNKSKNEINNYSTDA